MLRFCLKVLLPTAVLAFAVAGCNLEVGNSTVTPKAATKNPKLPNTGAIAYPVMEGQSYSIFEISPNGNGRRLLTDSAFGPSFAWSPDGTKLAFFDAGTIGQDTLINIIGVNRLEPKIIRSYTLKGMSASDISWSPNGKKLYVSGLDKNTSGFGAPLKSSIFAVDRESGSVRRVPGGGSDDEQSPQPSPSGKKIAFQLRRQITPDQLAELQADPEKTSQMQISSLIGVMNPDGSARKTLTGDQRSANSPRWLPNGRIAYSVFGNAADPENTDTSQIFSVAPTGGKPQAVKFPPSIMFSYAPDDRWVVYARRIDGNSELYVANQGDNVTQRLTKDSDDQLWPQWRP